MCVSMAVIKKTSFGEDVEKRESLCTVDGNANCTVIMENRWRFLKKVKIEVQYDPVTPLLVI